MTWDAFIKTCTRTTPGAAAQISYTIEAASDDGKVRMELSGFPVRSERWTRVGADAVAIIPARIGDPVQIGRHRGRYVFWVSEELADAPCTEPAA